MSASGRSYTSWTEASRARAASRPRPARRAHSSCSNRVSLLPCGHCNQHDCSPCLHPGQHQATMTPQSAKTHTSYRSTRPKRRKTLTSPSRRHWRHSEHTGNRASFRARVGVSSRCGARSGDCRRPPLTRGDPEFDCQPEPGQPNQDTDHAARHASCYRRPDCATGEQTKRQRQSSLPINRAKQDEPDCRNNVGRPEQHVLERISASQVPVDGQQQQGESHHASPRPPVTVIERRHEQSARQQEPAAQIGMTLLPRRDPWLQKQSNRRPCDQERHNSIEDSGRSKQQQGCTSSSTQRREQRPAAQPISLPAQLRARTRRGTRPTSDERNSVCHVRLKGWNTHTQQRRVGDQRRGSTSRTNHASEHASTHQPSDITSRDRDQPTLDHAPNTNRSPTKAAHSTRDTNPQKEWTTVTDTQRPARSDLSNPPGKGPQRTS